MHISRLDGRHDLQEMPGNLFASLLICAEIV
jgi:hypothetical protein